VGGAWMKLDLRIPTTSPSTDGYWTLGGAVGRAREVVREQGSKALWFKLLGETAYRRLAVYEFQLDRPIPAAPLQDVVELDFLRPDEIEDYLRLLPRADPEVVRARLSQGHRCLVARTERRIAHVRWSSTTAVLVDVLGCIFTLAPGTELGYGTFTDPDLRRQGLARAVRVEMLHRLRDEGLARSLAIVEPENTPALVLNETFGFRRIGLIGRLGAGSTRYCFCRTNAGEIPPGTMCAAKRACYA
jgi:ribosomal protein S18 acetylase RimI-like enzyme